MKAKLFFLIFIVILCIPAILPLFRQGFFQSDDGEWMIVRFSSFYQSFADGQFPVRFLTRLNFEYGYPVANFLYPGFMYLGIPIHVLGFGFVDTIKIIFGASMIGSAVFCYLWLSRFFDKLSSLIGSLFYLYTPYHLLDLYKRGSIGEVLSLAVLPFILWQIERKSFFWSSIGIAFLIISHNTLAVLFLPVIVSYKLIDLLLKKNKKYIILNTLYLILISLGLSAFFWIPAFFELQYTVFPQTQVSDWNNYFSDAGLIGLPTFLVLLLTIILFATSKIQIGKHRLTALLLIVGIISVFFATSLSSLFWSFLPVSFIQFPFRFLSLAIVCVAFLAAAIINTLNPRHSGDSERSVEDSRIPNGHKRFWASQNDRLKRFVLGAILIVFLAVSSFKYITPSEFFDKGEGFYSTNMDTTTVKNEYMPKWVKEKPVERFVEKVEIVDGVGKVENISYNSKKITFIAEVKDNIKVRINTIYYPGWNAVVNNQSTEIDYSNEKGIMELVLSKGENKVDLKFSETPLRLFADMLSLLSFIALVFFFFRRSHHFPV